MFEPTAVAISVASCVCKLVALAAEYVVAEVGAISVAFQMSKPVVVPLSVATRAPPFAPFS